jgi:tellurite resistance protein TehA-like permease
MQYIGKHTCNIHLKKQMKHWGQMFATYVYNHCNICNILIYFSNIHMKHLKRTSKISETFKIYTCNMHHIPVRP